MVPWSFIKGQWSQWSLISGPTQPIPFKKNLIKGWFTTIMLLGIDIPWNSAPKKLPFFALFLNDQNAKDTEKEGARSRRGEEHGRRCGGSIHEINSSQKFSWKCWCLFSPQKWGRFWSNLRCCIWFHPLTWKMFFGRQVFFSVVSANFQRICLF